MCADRAALCGAPIGGRSISLVGLMGENGLGLHDCAVAPIY